MKNYVVELKDGRKFFTNRFNRQPSFFSRTIKCWDVNDKNIS